MDLWEIKNSFQQEFEEALMSNYSFKAEQASVPSTTHTQIKNKKKSKNNQKNCTTKWTWITDFMKCVFRITSMW